MKMLRKAYFSKRAIPGLFFLIFVFSIQLTVNVRWLDSNHGPLELEPTALPTEPQPQPNLKYCQEICNWNKMIEENQLYLSHLFGHLLWIENLLTHCNRYWDGRKFESVVYKDYTLADLKSTEAFALDHSPYLCNRVTLYMFYIKCRKNVEIMKRLS